MIEINMINDVKKLMDKIGLYIQYLILLIKF